MADLEEMLSDEWLSGPWLSELHIAVLLQCEVGIERLRFSLRYGLLTEGASLKGPLLVRIRTVLHVASKGKNRKNRKTLVTNNEGQSRGPRFLSGSRFYFPV